MTRVACVCRNSILSHASKQRTHTDCDVGKIWKVSRDSDSVNVSSRYRTKQINHKPSFHNHNMFLAANQFHDATLMCL